MADFTYSLNAAFPDECLGGAIIASSDSTYGGLAR